MTKREKILKVARENPRLSRAEVAVRAKCDPSYVYMVLGPMPKPELVISGDNTVEQVLVERGNDYGDYASKAQFIQGVKYLMRTSPSWEAMDADMRESMEMIAHKMGRTLYGNPTHKDNFLDIAGYAKLVADRL